MFKNCLFTLLLLATLAWLPHEINGDESTNTTTATTATTVTPNNTTPPKIDVLASELCKKCTCDKDVKLLDCSGKERNNVFSEDEWKILQNGDIIFETIKMEHSNLTTVPPLQGYPVQNLYLGFNRISSIATGAFQNMTSLTKLDLSHNKLTSKALVPDVFKGQYTASDYLPLAKLTSLNLGYNELHALDSDLFEHTPKLEELIMCKNLMHVIDHPTEIAISGLRYLKTLDLSYIDLQELPDTLLHGPSELSTLILSGNLFDKLPVGLRLAVNLKELVLDENPIRDLVGDNVFPVLGNLQYLSIAYMQDLEQIGNASLSNLQSLTTLVASGNKKLFYIDSNALAKSTKNPDIFDYPPLEKLYISNNNLTTLPRDLVLRWDKVHTIDLRFNPWECDCANSWLIQSLMQEINSNTPALTNNVDCNSPDNFQTTKLLDLVANEEIKSCSETQPMRNGLILISVLVGVLIGIPTTIAILVLYKRGCFGLLNRNKSGANRALYNRASFNEDFHI